VVESDSDSEQITRTRAKKRPIAELNESSHEEVLPTKKTRRQQASGITPDMEKLTLDDKKKKATSPIKDLSLI